MNAAEVTLENALRGACIHQNEGNLIVAARIDLDIRTNPSSALQAQGEVVRRDRSLGSPSKSTHDPSRHTGQCPPMPTTNSVAPATPTAMRDRAAAADPNNAYAHINIGNAYLDRSELEVAGRMCVRVTERDPRNNAKLEAAAYSTTRLC